MQTADHGAIERSELRVVTERRPTLEELTDALFAWRVVRHVRSDAYFPFAEGIAAAAAAGVTAVVQPGGSRRDTAAIEIANRNGMAMVFTGRRHYRR
jgi:phosphoribosylaminoimidazolecarboxamide formyltransferase/IMP cyclohydrolase